MRFWPFKNFRSASRRKAAPLVQAVRMLRARYDAAATTADNRRHFANADHLSADTANLADIRRILRSRSRYEVANNSYAKGINLTLANDCVGTGPRLQMLTDNPELNRSVETAYGLWSEEIDLPAKLRTMRMAKSTDGEAFATLTTNPGLDSLIQLDVQLIEADRVTSPVMSMVPSDSDIDGVILDAYGNPASYTILRSHPGDLVTDATQIDEVPARSVIHWFRSDRSGQHRGIPEITPALLLFAQLRRYTLAVITAAETAADLAVIMKTNMLGDAEAAEVDPMTEIDLVRNMAVFMPEGWEPTQLKAEQPTTTYSEFKHEILNEIARCLNVPFNIAACNSAGYNYASGRLDHQTYYKSNRIEQSHMSSRVLNRILNAWIYEAMLTTDFAALRHIGPVAHQWFFDGTEHVDPAKEANAQATRLANHTTTLASEYAQTGKDWETELRQIAKEKALMKELGLTAADVRPQLTMDDKEDKEDEEEQEDEKQNQRQSKAA